MSEKDLVYICSPLHAPNREAMEKNMERAAYYTEVAAKQFGCRAIAPHSFLPAYLDDNIPKEREVALTFGLSVLQIAKAMVVCGDRINNGMKAEISKAKEWGIPVYCLLENDTSGRIVKIEERMRGNEV